ncbi:MAG: hypothetical protein ACE5FN_01875 [Leptospirillia bacterium]
MKKQKVVLVLTVLLTSAAALSLILATSRYLGFLQNPDSLDRGAAYRVESGASAVENVLVRVRSVTGSDEGVSPFLVSIFWVFEVSVVNSAGEPVDVDFDRITLRVQQREVRAMDTGSVLRMFNERMTGAFAAASARRGQQEVLDQLQAKKLGVTRVFPGYSRTSLVFFQPHPDAPDEAVLTLSGLRWARRGPVAPLEFRLRRVEGDRMLSGIESAEVAGENR